MEVAAQFGDNLVRELADMSQDELSVRASVHRTEISQFVRGLQVARIDTLAKLCASADAGQSSGHIWDTNGSESEKKHRNPGHKRCRRRDSNPRHADYDSAALTS